jgi:thioredoxin 1
VALRNCFKNEASGKKKPPKVTSYFSHVPESFKQTCIPSQSIFPNMAYEFTDASFTAEVLEKEQLTVVDLWAEWCGPCKIMTPVVEELAAEYAGKAVIGKLNVDDNPEVPTTYNVRGIPTFLIFKNGELRDKIVGATTKQALKEKIEAYM